MSLKEQSVKLIKKGFHVFPLNGKLPFKGSHGSKDAITDVEETRRRWDKVKEANIGIATGKEQGLFVVDIDTKEGRTGLDEWEHLLEQHGRIENIYEVITPTGGKHLYFKYPPDSTIKNSQSEIAQFIDVRGDGGYVVAEGSIIGNARYCAEISNNGVPDAPEWLIDLIEGKKKEKATGDAYEVPDIIPKGARNEELHRLAASLFGKGLHQNTIIEALKSERDHRCENPSEISDNEIKKIVLSVLNLERFSDYRQSSSILDFPTGTPLSDTFNAEFITEALNGTVLYCTETGHNLIWDGRCWLADDKNIVYRKVTDLFKKSFLKATAENNKEFSSHFKKTLNSTNIKNAINTMNKLNSVSISSFDDNKFLFNMNNGTYDLIKHTLSLHDKKNQITKLSSLNYDPAAKCPNWGDFLYKIFKGDVGLISYVQEAVGYCLTGDTGYHTFFICHGGGANGKSTFMETIRKLLGEYGNIIPAASLMEKKYDDVPHDIAQLNKSRFVVASESSGSRLLNEARIKELTGDSTIKVRHLYQEYFTMPITFKVWLQTNHKPTIKGTDHGIWRRIKMIPFNYKFEEDERINNYGERFLYDELPGIFNWACEGLQRLQSQEQWHEPDAVIEATQEYKKEEDIIGEWIETECTVSESSKCGLNDFFEYFKENSGYKYGKKTVKEYLISKGYKISKGYNGSYFIEGLSLPEKNEYNEYNNERPY
jgi:putative DNA primase/helicase